MSSELEQLQADVYGRLLDHEYFADVPIHMVRPRDADESLLVQTAVDRALAGAEMRNGTAGVAVLVDMPAVDVPEPNTPGPRLSAQVAVVVLENPAINMGQTGTKKSAELIGMTILHCLHHTIFQNLGSTLVAESMQPAIDPKGRIEQQVYFRIPIAIEPPTRVAPPVISGTAAAVTITCATADATVLYTTDGSYPHRDNVEAAEYGSAFAVESGAVVRAVALKDEYYASHAAATTIS